MSTGRLRNREITCYPGRVTNFKSSVAIGKNRMILKISSDDLTKAK